MTIEPRRGDEPSLAETKASGWAVFAKSAFYVAATVVVVLILLAWFLL